MFQLKQTKYNIAILISIITEYENSDNNNQINIIIQY